MLLSFMTYTLTKLCLSRWVDIMFNLRALPLQAVSLAVLPVFWTMPRLLDIQLALPAAVLEGACFICMGTCV